MKFDKFQMIELEQCAAPGNIGDSCAETFRYWLLKYFVAGRDDQFVGTDLIREAMANTKTDLGYLRHPESPWRENDFSSDQWLPRFLVAATLSIHFEANEMIGRTPKRTGNGDILSPLCEAAIDRYYTRDQLTWRDVALYGQALIFKFPWRWNDEKKWFERSSGSSADYLNWFMFLMFCEGKPSFWSKRAKKAVKPEVIIQKVRDYYKPEPRAFVVDLYERAVKKIYEY